MTLLLAWQLSILVAFCILNLREATMRESETEVQARRAKLEAFKLEYIEVLEGELGSGKSESLEE